MANWKIGVYACEGEIVPKVSVIIPTYNRQDLVQKTIDSVLNQTFRDWELIVVDDGSTDQSASVLQERYGSRIIYIYQENQGESAARNRGLCSATGEYVAFLDSDDLWHPNKLQRQIEAFAEKPELGLVSTQAYWINYEGLLLRQAPHGHGRENNDISWQDLVLDNVVAGGGSAAMVRRSCLSHVGGFDSDIRFGEEWDLWIRLARHYPLTQIPQALIYYRLHRFGTRGWAPRPSEAERLYSEHCRILQKAFADCPYDSQICNLLCARALGRINMRRAIVQSALGNIQLGQDYWRLAFENDPQQANDVVAVSDLLVRFVVGYASLETGSQITGVERILNRIVDNLPSSIRVEGSFRRVLQARCLAELAFLAACNKSSNLARLAAFNCLIKDVAWMRNFGLLKLLVTGGRHLWPESITL